MQPSLILYAPTPGVERGGGISAARIVDGPAMMDSVLERLGLPAELAGEPKAEDKKPKAPTGKDNKANGKQQRQAPEPEPEPEPEPTAETPEPEPEPEPEPTDGDPNAQAEPEPEPEPEAVAEPEFTDEQKAWMEEQTKAQTAELDQAKTELTAALERSTELEGKITALGQTPMAVAAINPLFTVDDPALLTKHEEELANFEKWALEHWDGVEATEASADGKTPATPGYTSAQVRKRYAELKEVRDKVIPAARQAIEVRKEQAKIAKQAYPELFDSKRPESQLAEQILRQAPGLKALFPNIYLVLGDAIRGEKARLAAAKAKKPAANPTAGALNGRPKPPRPGAGASATVKPKKAGNEISAERFMKLGGGRDALVEMLSGAELPMAER